VQVRESDYSRPQTLRPALAGVDRLLLVSGSEPGQRAAQHANVIKAARTAGIPRILYTSMLNADDSMPAVTETGQRCERERGELTSAWVPSYAEGGAVTREFHSGRGSRAAMLAAGVGAVLVAAVSLAPVAGAEAGPLAGTWTVRPSPNPKGARASALQAVSCSGPGSCVAVGSSSYPSGQQIPSQRTLVERLSDGRWTVVRTPAIRGATSSVLNGVSCPVGVFCVAVGSVQFAAPHRSPELLAETWNGTSWTDKILPAPPGGSEPGLAAVSCAAKGDCVAVGGYIYNKAGTYRPLAEQLNGSMWSVAPAPVPPHGGGTTGNSELTGVDCPTATLCEVVGIVAYNDTLQSVFAYGLNGSTWTYQRQVNPGPDPGNTDDAVSCSGAGACTSVGSVQIVGELALAEYWDGSTWARQVTPAPVNRPDTALSAVSCDGGSSCVAVGESYRIDPKNGHLIDGRVMGETWNGRTWSQSPPVAPSGVTAALEGISCPSSTACIAVGGASTASGESTLVEAYTG
jgi:hypothetical protein